ncbi:MAG: hypothetical protein ABI895_33255 [Deltaproteobacteria bacterium]
MRTVDGSKWRLLLELGVAGALLSVAPALPAAELMVRGPDACPDASELGFRVERAIGMPLVASAPLRFRVLFEPPATAAQGYTARLDARALDGELASTPRSLRAQDCSRLGDAVAVSIALAIGSSEAETAERTRSAAGHSGASVAEREGARTGALPALTGAKDVSTPAEPERTDGAGLSPVLAISALADSGSLPSAGLGVGGAAELRGQHLALRVGGLLLFDQHVTTKAAVGAPGADMSLLLGSLSGCAAPLGSYRQNLTLFTCAGWELGRLAAAGTGVSTPRSANQLWSAPRVDAGLSWALPATRLRFDAQLTAAAPLKRDDFFLRELGQLHRPPGAIGRLSLGVEVLLE